MSRHIDGVPMNLFARLLSVEDILLNLDVAGKYPAFEEIASHIACHYQIDRALIYENLCVRENLGVTAIGEGVAIPHAKIKGLRRAIASFVRTALPIEFDAPDGKPVSQILVLLVPSNATNEHLDILAAAAGMVCDPFFREHLNAASDPYAVRQMFVKWTPLT